MNAFSPLPLPELAELAAADIVQAYAGMGGWRWRYCCAGVDQVEVLAVAGITHEPSVKDALVLVLSRTPLVEPEPQTGAYL